MKIKTIGGIFLCNSTNVIAIRLRKSLLLDLKTPRTVPRIVANIIDHTLSFIV
jgi:hypothetical protein